MLVHLGTELVYFRSVATAPNLEAAENDREIHGALHLVLLYRILDEIVQIEGQLGQRCLRNIGNTWRIRRVSPTRLEIEMTLTDPEAFEEPFTIRRAYVPMPAGSRFEEYICENNQDI